MTEQPGQQPFGQQEPSLPVPAGAWAPAPSQQDLPVVRRPSHARMLPPEPPPVEDQLIIGRSMLSSQRERKPQTSRERRIAGNLPAWDPTPPGEIVVRRTR